MLASSILQRSVFVREIRRQREIIDADPAARATADALEEIGRRLGTAHEQPGDTELACRLGHQLRNQICGVMLRRSFA